MPGQRVPSCACLGPVRLTPALVMLLLPVLTVVGGMLAAVVVAVVRGR
jgi:hypothetical protein